MTNKVMDDNWRRLYAKASPSHQLEMLRHAMSSEPRGEATQVYINYLEGKLAHLENLESWRRNPDWMGQ